MQPYGSGYYPPMQPQQGYPPAMQSQQGYPPMHPAPYPMNPMNSGVYPGPMQPGPYPVNPMYSGAYHPGPMQSGYPPMQQGYPNPGVYSGGPPQTFYSGGYPGHMMPVGGMGHPPGPAATTAATTAPPKPATKTVSITVIEAEGLKRSDFMGLGKGDPYCKIIREQSGAFQRTKTMKSTLKPKWHETFTFQNVKPDETFVFEIYDEDDVGAHDFLGRAIINSRNISVTGEQKLKLEARLGIRETIYGSILFRISQS
eukprot:TRINITY_DN2738_c0_g1_i1.p1 TRINITY_DN2738_c0_g1~~TRINITY_DN2738_c0_g1_i1.p1  ORF type:complete len:256 (+),score=137.45 TRINITY_DN2738_c0_g1_i1:261-1028(+)